MTMPATNPRTWPNLRRLEPVSRVFGEDRGTPIDRFYIERFLQQHSADVRGRVMEVGDDSYTRRFGGDRVKQADVLHAVAGNRRATLVGDLCNGAGVPQGAFDCMILTQVLPFVSDPAAALATAARALAPGGVILATVPGISQISRYDMQRWGDFWRFTDLSARRLFGDAMGAGSRIDVAAHGNVLVATAFLHGLSLEEVALAELEHTDQDYQVLITIRAQKAVARPGVAA